MHQRYSWIWPSLCDLRFVLYSFLILVLKVNVKCKNSYVSSQLNIKLANIPPRSFQQSFRSASVSKRGRGSSGKMFFVAGARNSAGGGGGNERR